MTNTGLVQAARHPVRVRVCGVLCARLVATPPSTYFCGQAERVWVLWPRTFPGVFFCTVYKVFKYVMLLLTNIS